MSVEKRPGAGTPAAVAVAVVVIAELLGVSVWFTPNAVADQLGHAWGLTPRVLGHLTGAVQLGFIAGTLFFALSGLADRWPASRIFFVSALGAAAANALFALVQGQLAAAVALRALTGVALAGVYPVGMKLVIGWAPVRRSIALGWLVGMLSLGTALPHLLRGMGGGIAWQWPVLMASVLAVTAGVMVLILGDGPHAAASGRLHWGSVLHAFRRPGFRAAALGYFGHMWELYAAWTLAPFLLAGVLERAHGPSDAVPWLAFAFIGSGFAGCVAGGYWSGRAGAAAVATTALAVSGIVCLSFPWIAYMPLPLVLTMMLIWGVTVVADSPQFSALASATAPADAVGSALALMNSIGFLITVISIELTTALWGRWQEQVTWVLALGPILGVWVMLRRRSLT